MTRPLAFMATGWIGFGIFSGGLGIAIASALPNGIHNSMYVMGLGWLGVGLVSEISVFAAVTVQRRRAPS